MIALCAALALAADLDVPGDHATLAEAVGSAETGDVIRLAAGRHEAGVEVVVDLTIEGAEPGVIVWIERLGVPAFRVTSAASLTLRDLSLESSTSRGVDAEALSAVLLDGVTAVGLSTRTSGGVVRAVDAELSVIGGRFEANTASFGGGAFASQGGDLWVEGATFVGNSSAADGGGAISATGSGAVTLRGDLFEGNTCNAGGGAVYVDGGRPLVVEDSTFVANVSSFGAAIRQSEGDLTLLRSHFEGYADPPPPSEGLVRVDVTGTVTVEDSSFVGGRTGFYGGAMEVVSADALVFRRSTFDDNQTGWAGSAVRAVAANTLVLEDCSFTGNRVTDPTQGGAVRIDQGRNVEVVRTTFAGNEGGGLSVLTLADPSEAQVLASTFTDNVALPAAALELSSFSTVDLDGNVFDRNAGAARGAVVLGGAGDVVSVRNRYCANIGDVSALYTSADTFGTVNDLVVGNIGVDGVMRVVGPTSWTATHSTFVSNVSPEGGALHVVGGIVSVDDSVFAWNEADGALYVDAPRFPVVANDLFWENIGGPLGGDLADELPFDPDRMINADPMLVDADPALGCDELRAWPVLGSPLIDAGSDVDLDDSPGDIGYTGGRGADPALWVDADGDGFVLLFDCDDTRAEAFPGADETCNDADDDCDGEVDEDAVDAPTWYVDGDGDGFGDAMGPVQCDAPPGHSDLPGDCDDGEPEVNPDADERCNARDDDCDLEIDEEGAVDAPPRYADVDGDTWGDVAVVRYTCGPLDGHVDRPGDCDDGEVEVSPDAEERCNERDDDCDGEIDGPLSVDALTWYADADADGHGDPEAPAVDCDAPDGHLSSSDDCDDTRPDVSPSAVELCNGVDDDCDLETDEPDAADAPTWHPDGDGDGFGDTEVSVVACEGPTDHVLDGTDCADDAPTVFPGSVEVCDGLDNDCEGTVDGPVAVDAVPHWPDADGDGWGVDGATEMACESPPGFADQLGDCDDTRAGVNPDATEINGNGIDDDCDGLDGVGDTDTTKVDTGDPAGGGADKAPVGCGCSTAVPSTGWGGALLALLLIGRRRC
ncbi:MAG: putative outer membrane repeat protein [Myxococcota bacterium]